MRMLLIIFTFFLLFMTACEAPRLNPLDPQSRNYIKSNQTRINVLRLYPPNSGISGINVEIMNLNMFKLSDSDGIVVFEHEPVESLFVSASGTGYFPANVDFKINGLINNEDLYLNAVPQIKSAKFYSIRDNSSNLTYLALESDVSDPDGPTDIVSVYLVAESGNFRESLGFDAQSGKYSTKFNINNLPGNLSPEELPELNFHCIVKNLNNDSLISLPYSIRRVINEKLDPLSPNLNQAETDSIKFSWKPLVLDYSFSYSIVLYSLNDNIQRIGKFGPIPSTADQFMLNDPSVLDNLAAGWYLWILQAEDAIGNICQSNALNFQYIKQAQ